MPSILSIEFDAEEEPRNEFMKFIIISLRQTNNGWERGRFARFLPHASDFPQWDIKIFKHGLPRIMWHNFFGTHPYELGKGPYECAVSRLFWWQSNLSWQYLSRHGVIFISVRADDEAGMRRVASEHWCPFLMPLSERQGLSLFR